MINLTINNQRVEIEEGTKLIQAIEKIGFKVPTLCYHKALTPYGACRLCVVEIHERDRVSFEASCSYPALDEISVFTDTDRVKRARKITAELLLARCPDSEIIQKIASDFGVKEPRIKKKYDDCIQCGLCVRMCQERMGRGAIGFSGRGFRKKLEPPFGKHNQMCWICGACNFICPVGKKISTLVTSNPPIPIPDSYNMGLDSRPAVYIFYPQTVPNKAVIDKEHCLYFNYDVCKICEEVCDAKAIDREQKDQKIELNIGAVILSPGYEIFEASLADEYGYGRFPNVITSLEFERILSASGPFSGKILRPDDKTEPKKIAFLQCVGSRDTERPWCSAVCCMYATKEALIAKEHLGEDLKCDIFFMDVRAFGKGFEQYYERAKEAGVNYIRCRVSSIKEVPQTKNLIVEYLTEDDKKTSAEYELVVLSVGLQPPKAAKEISEKLGIKLNKFNFCETSVFKPVESSRDVVYVAGPFTEPKDIPETVMQASACVSKVLSLLKDARGSLIKHKEYPPEIDVSGQEPRIGVFICHCGINIAGVVNVLEVVEYAKILPDVVFVMNNLYTCSVDACENIKKMIKEHNLNRVVVASCTPRTHEMLFRSVLQEAGLNPYLFEMANIRDQCSWVHTHEPEKATKKAKDLVRMAVAKSRLLEPLYKSSAPIKKSALVIGGGLSGLVSALEIANQGQEVYLVEKEKELGGITRRIHYLLNGENPQEALKSLIETVKGNNKIHLFTDAKIESVEGSIGNFKTKVATNSGQPTNYELEHGGVIVATGATEYKPTEYLYGQDARVITQLELEEKLSNLKSQISNLKSVVMIQCVGSRDNERPYCSRVCCAEAVKNALKIKETSPATNVYILYRDMRTYGFGEMYYAQAREKGVVFIRYEEDKKPEVSKNANLIKVRIFDQILRMHLVIPADLVVLSAGTVAEDTNKTVAQFLKVPLTQEKFFLEAHMKLRPVDFATEGIFLCGLAHSSKSIEESIIQSQAAAGRAGSILSKDSIELEANISFVVDENCDGCAYCIEPCPFKAITLLEYMKNGAIKKTVEVNESLCKGCGSCMATCPKKGIFIKGFKLEQIAAQIEAALQPIG